MGYSYVVRIYVYNKKDKLIEKHYLDSYKGELTSADFDVPDGSRIKVVAGSGDLFNEESSEEIEEDGSEDEDKGDDATKRGGPKGDDTMVAGSPRGADAQEGGSPKSDDAKGGSTPRGDGAKKTS